jgi:nucleoside-diphosphate-sugar epimerase
MVQTVDSLHERSGTMNIALFGATGRLGGAILEAALRDGHRVAVLVRDPSRLTPRRDALTVIAGDARDRDAVERTLRGGEAAISALATSASRGEASRKPLSAATRNIVEAMERLGIRRLVASSAKAIPMPGDMPDMKFRALRALVRLVVPRSHEDSVMAAAIVAASALDWTIVRVDRVSFRDPTGSVRAGPVDERMRIGLTRGDAADFMLRELAAREFLLRAPAICSRATRP